MDDSQIIQKDIVNDFFKYLKTSSINKNCADCGKRSPIWASITFGTFICAECAGRHREMGVNVSKVKSTVLDSWKICDLRRMCVSGNQLALKLPQTPDTKEKYLKSKWYEKEIDELVKEDEIMYPGSSFLKKANEKKKTDSFFEKEEIEEKEVKKLGSSKFIVETKKEVKKEIQKEEVNTVRISSIKSNDFSSLEPSSEKAFTVNKNEAQTDRLGFMNVNIVDHSNGSKYSYKNNISNMGSSSHSYGGSSFVEGSAESLKNVVRKITKGSKSVIGGIVTKFSSKK